MEKMWRMKVVHLSTTVSDASANTRLHRALLREGINSKIITLAHTATCSEILDIERTLLDKIISHIRLIKEGVNRKQDKSIEGYPFSYGENGINLKRNDDLLAADIIHLHWICNELSINDLKKIIELKKPIVWTCHDSWAFTGGCHVRGGCQRYQQNCGMCKMLGSVSKRDNSTKILKRKKREWNKNAIVFIAPSNWMKDSISKSSLFYDNRVEVIPNALELNVYHPMDEKELFEIVKTKIKNDKINILFGALDVNIPYKGFSYLIELLERLEQLDNEKKDKICLHVVGEGNINHPVLNRYDCKFWGYVREPRKMAAIYNLADVLLYPSTEDNLPGVVMESLACGTPVVAFNTGGISDMVEHKINGYIVEKRNAEDLLRGLLWVLENNYDNILGVNGVRKVQAEFDSKVVAEKHIALYSSLIAEENTRLL